MIDARDAAVPRVFDDEALRLMQEALWGLSDLEPPFKATAEWMEWFLR